MKKLWIVMLVSFIIIFGATIGLVVYNSNRNSNKFASKNKVEEISEKIIDECTEEYEELEASSSNEKISPNCKITFKRYYNQCGHITNEYVDIPEELVNKTEEELIQKYNEWKLEKYSANQVVFYQEYEGSCGQHFIIKDNEGKINIYRINESNEEELYEKTEISEDYLTETDKIEIKNGIRVNGIEDLNQLIENFE